MTGITNLSPEVTGKRVELLKECVPGLRRVVYLWNAGLRGAADVLREVQSAAQRLGLGVEAVEAHSADGIRDQHTGDRSGCTRRSRCDRGSTAAGRIFTRGCGNLVERTKHESHHAGDRGDHW